MKKSILAVQIICLVLAVMFMMVGILLIIGNNNNDYSQPKSELSDWMIYLKDDAPVKQIAIPGAHDAGTAGLSYLAETQDKNTKELLDCGTRYFDIRTKLDNEQLRVYHGPFSGVELSEMLMAFKVFLTAHPSEMLILDFQHFAGGAEEVTLAEVVKCFGGTSMFVTNNSGQSDKEFINNLKLSQCRGKCLIFWGVEITGSENYVFQRNNDDGTRENSVMHSYYQGSLNKKSSSTYIKKALPHYIDLYKQEGQGLFVLQGQLTDGMFVFGPHFRESTHTDNMNYYVAHLVTSPDLQYINIIIRDYVTPEKNCLTLKLNIYKGWVKNEFQNYVEAAF